MKITAQPTRGARLVALGGAGTAMPSSRDLDANPAAWATEDRRSLGLDVSQWYGLAELRAASAFASARVAGIGVAAGAQTFGLDLFRETRLVLVAARALRPGTHRPIQAGVRLRETFIRFKNYGGHAFPSLSFGLLVHVTPAVAMGAAATNLVVLSSSMRNEVERALFLGVAYTRGRHLMVASDVVKEVRSPACVRLGLEMYPVRVLALRAGLTTEPPRASGGIGLRTSHVVIDVAVERHVALGWSPLLSVRVHW